MKYPKIKLIYDRKKRGGEGKPGVVEIEISFCGKKMDFHRCQSSSVGMGFGFHDRNGS